MNEQDKKELVKYRIDRAKETLKEVDILVENKLWNTSVNRLYYACYYAVTALLIYTGINTQTHAGVRQMFGLHFIKTGLIHKDSGKFYTDIFDKRQTSDYDDFVVFTEIEIRSMIAPAHQLIEEIINIIKL
ncbi:HEPN domain-containing protein [Saccharicrinis sp. FJH2]|uniref:HEPN domain-containing protein n=1 Tax=Saccharicrinis sp. FJH65 TaxID=3344659 RepID=UPI0035F4141D